MKQSMKVLSKAFSILLYFEVAVVIALAVVCFAGVPFGYKNFVVQTGSMTPTIPIGSMAYINQNVDPETVVRGDIIAFNIDDSAEKVCIHRAVTNDTQAKNITTKGDANSAQDIAPVEYSNLVGRLDLHVPQLGTISAWASNHGVVFAGIIIVTVLLEVLCTRLSQSRQGNGTPEAGLEVTTNKGEENDQCSNYQGSKAESC